MNKNRIEKTRMKKAAGLGVSVCLLLAAVLGLTACGNPETQTQESTAAVQEESGGTEEAMAAQTMQEETQAVQESAQETLAETENGTQAGTEDAADAPAGEMITDATGSFEGIVVDAAMNSLVIDTKDGIMYSFSYPESGVEMELSDGLLLGMSVLVESEDGMAFGVQDGPTQPAADRDALAFAADILFACRYGSMDSLANLAGFPLYVRLDDGDLTAENAEEFLALPEYEIFSEERVEAVLSADLYELTELDGGKYVLGSDEGTPNITFQEDDGRDSGFAVVGIN